tara:strand:- start:503 stop:1141 length:639 start_codon:yes stop_codon:yes gene_type:complete
MLKKKISSEVGIFDSEINRIDQIQKDIADSSKELKRFFKKLSKSKKLDDINKIYGCFHNHVKRIDQNFGVIKNGMNNLVEILYAINNINTDSIQKSSPKVDHSLGVITGYELFRLKQYSKILNEEDTTNRRIIYSVNRLEEGYLSRGYKIEDYTGDDFVIEKNLKVVNRIEDENLAQGKKIIARMIKPTIYYKDVVLKPGEVEIKTGTKKEK